MDEWKIGSGKAQIVLGIIAFVVGFIGMYSFIPFHKIILYSIKLQSLDIFLGFLILIFGIFLSAICITFGLDNIKIGRTNEEEQGGSE